VDVDISADAVFDAFGFEFVAEAEKFFGGFHVGRENWVWICVHLR
jgi:hypothetical protein